jgi:murein DD-endopeptidase MepM/ murein hydrolase activator NlpD
LATKQQEKHIERTLGDDITKEQKNTDLQFHLSAEERFETDEEETYLLEIYHAIYDFLRLVGITTIQSTKIMSKAFAGFYDRHLKRHVEKIEDGIIGVFKVIFKGIRFVGFKINLFLQFFVDAKNVVKAGYNKNKEKGFFVRLFNANKAFWQGVGNNMRVFAAILNYVVPAAAIVGFAFLVNYVMDFNFAVSVEYNGNHIGYIANETVFEKAEATLQERMVYLNEEEKIDKIPKFSVAVVPKEEIKTDAELTDAIIQSSSQNIVQATGIRIDGHFYGAVKDSEAIKQKLEEKLAQYKTGKEGEEVRFTKDVEWETGLYLASNIVKEEDILSLLDSEEEKDAYYQVAEGDTPIIIAAKYDLTVDELVQMNPGILDKLLIGQSVLVNKSQPFLPVSVITTEKYTIDLDYNKKVVESNKYYKGQTVVTKKGVKGQANVTAKVERVNGVEVGRKIIEQVVTKEPVDEIVTKGTNTLYVDTPYTGGTSNAGLIWPVSGSYISSYFGGARRHTGLDMAFRGNGYGQPIRAALPGKVVFAGWSGSYGRLVKIDHGNGIQTWYAHASSILVKAGDYVSQGQTIARVGSTGNSTGNHLHFEVHKNGARQNPLKWLP